ncbi:hypothetical protein A3SI_15855 [Nitritalea halalkaliphila LW7]|uniref:Uncharacterized protein n=1 Tax=Nitritalea halalkaliphila LW7 TaxID=1189621 RepID=I5BY35_9BACT|nr:hypothetical protein [Nitritalea halalkaliphila]EIM74487.1 hypothetical protein A3SI_15855 [Nitritalea halalkaliphila LW7]
MKRVFIKDKLYIIDQVDQERELENDAQSSVEEVQEAYHFSMKSPSVDEVKKALSLNRQVFLLLLGINEDGPIYMSEVFLNTHGFRWDLLTGSSEEEDSVVFHCFEYRYSLATEGIVKIWRVTEEEI